ncbi:MAG: response regulator [Desulfobacteraceae bacterium]|nr:response regulator [Desulfobacteraceae bacterium]
MTQKRKLKILIADDEAHIRFMLRTLMLSMNAEVVGEAKDGKEAIELFKKQSPHIMLLDINMPFKSGEEVLKEIIDEFPDAFIIMMSSVSDSETVQNCLEAGAASYILKDTPIMEMKGMISEAWTDHKKNKG